MADKSIIELKKVDQLQADSSIPVYQDGTAKRVTGDQIADFARNQVSEYTESAQQSANSAEQSAKQVAEKVEEVQNVSANPPKIQNGNWWVYNPSTKKYEDSGYDASLSFQIGSVITGEAGSEAIVKNVGTESDVILNMTIPRGEPGDATSDISGYTKVIGISAMGQKSNGTVLSINNIRGNTVLGGTPAYDAPVSMESVEGPLRLHMAGKNLVRPVWNLEGQTQTGVTCTRSGNSFTLAGTNSGSGGINFYIQRYDTDSAFSLPAGTYTMSGMPARETNEALLLGLYRRLPGGTNEQLAYDYGKPSRNKQTFTLSEATDNLFLAIVVGVGVNADGVTVTPQIEAGSEATAYEEPSNAIVEIPLIGVEAQTLEPLRMSYIGRYGGGNRVEVPDRIIRKDGVWCVERNAAVADLTAATWGTSANYLTPNLNGDLIRGKESHWVLCTHFPPSGANPSTVWTAGIWMGFWMAINKASLPNGTATTPEEMTAWCAAQAEAGTPVLVCYAVNDPIYEELHQDVQILLNTLAVPGGVCSVWFEGEVAPTADIGIPRGDFPSENARALAMTRADRTLSNLTDYQKALHNIGGRPNRNLLINHRMIGTGNPGSFPVNQKGQKVYTPALNETTIDGWKIEVTDPGTAKVEIKDGFVTITNTSQTSGIQFKQTVPIEALSAGGEYTISSYIKEVSADVFCILAMTDPPYINPIRIKPVPNEIVSGTVTALPQVSSGSYKFIYEIPPGGFVTIADQKMEEGPVQTLGWIDDDGNVHLFETPDYGEELAQCQQYQLALRQYFISPAVHFSADYIDFSVPTPIEMRTVPAIEADGISIISDGKGNQTGFTLSVMAKSSNAVRVRATKTGHGLSFTEGVRLEVTGEHAMLNANM